MLDKIRSLEDEPVIRDAVNRRVYFNTIAPVDVMSVGLNGSCALRSSLAELYNTRASVLMFVCVLKWSAAG